MDDPIEAGKAVLGFVSLLVILSAALTMLSNPSPEALAWFVTVWVAEQIPLVVDFLVAAPVMTVFALFVWTLLQEEGLVG